ncbi:BnaA06g12000D [Brassica napus]|uniref:BnaA06g12000D protein n=2 Tax=Brassica TaxID=3705 RepID=A0A078GM04_BRANA|nr:BnaA06g12000D [Brassica napus]VDC65980.1 unnamed protein product [Brassica rapa]
MLFHYLLDLYHKKSKSCLRWPTFGSYCVFAKWHIPPLAELRYDYGMSYDNGDVDEDGSMGFRGGTMNRKLWVKTVGTKSLKFINLGRKSLSVRDQLRHIPLLTELRYDYGMSYDTGEVDEDGSRAFRVFTFAVDGSTPIEATPFSYLIPSFADDDNHQMENISSPTSQVVHHSKVQTVV